MSAFSFPPNSAAWAAARSLCDAVVEPRRTREVGNHRQTEQEGKDKWFFRLWDEQFKWEWPNICPQGTLEGWKEELPECEGGVFEKRGEICCQKLESFKEWLQKLHLIIVLCRKCGFKSHALQYLTKMRAAIEWNYVQNKSYIHQLIMKYKIESVPILRCACNIQNHD